MLLQGPVLVAETQHPKLKEERFIWLSVVKVSIHNQLVPGHDGIVVHGHRRQQKEGANLCSSLTLCAGFLPYSKCSPLPVPALDNKPIKTQVLPLPKKPTPHDWVQTEAHQL